MRSRLIAKMLVKDSNRVISEVIFIFIILIFLLYLYFLGVLWKRKNMCWKIFIKGEPRGVEKRVPFLLKFLPWSFRQIIPQI